MTAVTSLGNSPEHIAHSLWEQRNKFRALHAADFATEMTILDSVRKDVSAKFYQTAAGAYSFYRDLNTATLQEKHA